MTKPISYDLRLTPSYRWTTERFERAIEAGAFDEDDRIELLYATIIELTSAGADHEYCVSLLARFFRRWFSEKFQYREEKSLRLDHLASLPHPDLVVATDRDYGRERPTSKDVYLVAEVSNSSLQRDRTVKVQLYAEARLAEYWIVNLIDRQVEVHLEPNPELGIYGSVAVHSAGATFTSPFAGEVVVDEILPPEEEQDVGVRYVMARSAGAMNGHYTPDSTTPRQNTRQSSPSDQSRA